MAAFRIFDAHSPQNTSRTRDDFRGSFCFICVQMLRDGAAFALRAAPWRLKRHHCPLFDQAPLIEN